MTFEQLLELDSTKLESISDQELRTILEPCLEICPPIDLEILQKEKLELEGKKLLEKEQKKAEKKKLKELEKLKLTQDTNLTTATGVSPTIPKKKPKKSAEVLKHQMEVMQKMLQDQLEKTKAKV